MKKKELENILDKIAAGIRSEQVDDGAVSEATGRVWSRLESEDARRMRAFRLQDAGAPAVDRIEGCADFQSLIPAYLDSRLSEARTLLLVDHTHECIPCRKALKQAREARVAPVRDVSTSVRAGRARTQTFSLRPVVLRWGIAAALLIGLGLVALPMGHCMWWLTPRRGLWV